MSRLTKLHRASRVFLSRLLFGYGTDALRSWAVEREAWPAELESEEVHLERGAARPTWG